MKRGFLGNRLKLRIQLKLTQIVPGHFILVHGSTIKPLLQLQLLQLSIGDSTSRDDVPLHCEAENDV